MVLLLYFFAHTRYEFASQWAPTASFVSPSVSHQPAIDPLLLSMTHTLWKLRLSSVAAEISKVRRPLDARIAPVCWFFGNWLALKSQSESDVLQRVTSPPPSITLTAATSSFPSPEIMTGFIPRRPGNRRVCGCSIASSSLGGRQICMAQTYISPFSTPAAAAATRANESATAPWYRRSGCCGSKFLIGGRVVLGCTHAAR
jgi:hypothetical protein